MVAVGVHDRLLGVVKGNGDMHPSALWAPDLWPNLKCASSVVRGDANCQATICGWVGDDLDI